MNFKTIFIANIGEEDTSLIQLSQDRHQSAMIQENYKLAERFVWAAEDNLVLITPYLLDKLFVYEVNQLLNHKNFLNLAPKISEKLVCLSILSDPKILTPLIKLISQNPGIKLVSSVASAQFYELMDFLRKRSLNFITPESPAKENSWTTAFFDSKAGFRQTALFLNHDFPNLPQGMICYQDDEILGWVNYFLKQAKDCLLKTNRGSAGVGIKILKVKELKEKNLNQHLRAILQSQPYWQKEAVIVEEFIKPNLLVCGGAPSVEFMVNDKGGQYLYTCGMRISPLGHFRGVELGKGAVPETIEKKLVDSGKSFAQFLWQSGYRGFFDIDWVYGKKGKVYPVETNLRRTGGTHVWEVGKKLLGSNFLSNYYLASRSLVDAPAFKKQSYAQIKPALHDLLYPIKNKKEGLILTYVNDFYFHGQLGYMVIASSRQRAYEIEEKFLKRLA